MALRAKRPDVLARTLPKTRGFVGSLRKRRSVPAKRSPPQIADPPGPAAQPASEPFQGLPAAATRARRHGRSAGATRGRRAQAPLASGDEATWTLGSAARVARVAGPQVQASPRRVVRPQVQAASACLNMQCGLKFKRTVWLVPHVNVVGLGAMPRIQSERGGDYLPPRKTDCLASDEHTQNLWSSDDCRCLFNCSFLQSLLV